MNDQTLTQDQIIELRAFLRVHFPLLADEIDQVEYGAGLDRIPLLLEICWQEMQRYRAGEATRYISFLDLLPPQV